jgi:hypothetical protein
METKWIKLSKLMKAESGILSERNEPHELKKLYESGHAFICEVEGEIVAHVAMFKTSHHKWLELGSMFVREDYRGKRMSSDLFFKCLSVVHNGFRILVVTHHPKVIHLCIKAGLYESPCTKTLDPPDEIVCGPCDRVSSHEKTQCPFRHKRNKCATFFL